MSKVLQQDPAPTQDPFLKSFVKDLEVAFQIKSDSSIVDRVFCGLYRVSGRFIREKTYFSTRIVCHRQTTYSYNTAHANPLLL